MDYSTVIELDNVTVDDCLELFLRKNMITIINDGRISNFEKCKGEKDNGYQSKKTKRKRNYSYKRK